MAKATTKPIAKNCRPRLALPRGRERRQLTPWNQTLLDYLEQSGVFAIEEESFPVVKVGRRWRNWNLMRLNGELIGLDTWDTNSVLDVYQSTGHFGGHPGGAFNRVRLILKINARRNDPWLAEFTATTGIPVTPWTMFPYANFPVGSIAWGGCENGHKYAANLTGKNTRNSRPRWVRAARDINNRIIGRAIAAGERCDGTFYIAATDASGHPVHWESMENYLSILRDCRWGVCLPGTGDKTRREPEFLSCGFPLALCYQPNYPFPFVANEHYLWLEKPKDLRRLVAGKWEADPAKFASVSRGLWEEYFSPAGMANLLLNLAKKYS